MNPDPSKPDVRDGGKPHYPSSNPLFSSARIATPAAEPVAAEDVSNDTTSVGERPPAPPPHDIWHRFTLWALIAVSVICGVMIGLLLLFSVDLPQVENLENYRPIASTELLDVHGHVVGSFAMQRRVVVGYDDFAPVLRQAVISIEDKSFESHSGINSLRVVGAVWRDVTSKSRSQGASTITMQLARNLFLSLDRTYSRKLQEILLAIQIEHHFTKPQIFALYGNQIYLGHGEYGFEAASQYYFSKHARDLTLTEAAMLAGIPKSPTNYSPVLNPDRAFKRRNLVITEMEADGAITPQDAEMARRAPLGLHLQAPANSEAPWFDEEIRRDLEKQYGTTQLYEGSLRVYTGIDPALQETAARAMLKGLAQYERRHGWRGHLLNVTTAGGSVDTFQHPDWVAAALPGGYVHALVTNVAPAEVTLKIGKRIATLTPESWKWTANKAATTFLQPGDVVYVHIPDAPQAGAIWQVELEQDSGAQGALFAMDNATGDVIAMVGGRDFQLSQFNRATQAARQTGSSFKPYVYTAAVEAGVKPEDRIVDAPTSFATASGPYTPHNYDGKYGGNMSILAAFADSRNIPALKLTQRVGIRKVIDVARRFGITSPIPAYLPVALGSADVTLAQQVGAYSVFPNAGLRVTPRMVRRITTPDGRVLQEGPPDVADATTEDTAHTMLTLLQEVTRSGTAASASQLKHPLGGKTGTTNSFTDAWFIGFSPSVTAGVWVGYDDRQTLGDKETGARAALPIWIDFMRAVIASHPGEEFAIVKQRKPIVPKPPVAAVAQTPPQQAPPTAPHVDPATEPAANAETPAATNPAKPKPLRLRPPSTTPTPAAAPAAAPDASQQ